MYQKLSINVLVFGLLIMSIISSIVLAQATEKSKRMRFDLAENTTRAKFDDLNLFTDGMPAYGSAFVTQGYIYPEGTLHGNGDFGRGVLDNGEPEFPEHVLGEWTTYGWMIGDGARTKTGEWVVSTQVFQFTNGSTIVTDGFEIADMGAPVTRAITGGTYDYRNAKGEMTQVLHGFTEELGGQLTVEFNLES